MSRYKLQLNILVLIMAFAWTPTFAQPQTDSDKNEGNEFNDWNMEQARNEYWSTIRTSGEEKDLGKIELNAYNAMRSLENRTAFKALSNPAWQAIAASQEGHNSGRVRDITADPNNPNIVYVATSTGGVWKTTNITASPVQWVNLSDRLPTLMCGAIAFIPPSTLILGTGESDGDGYRWPPGQGLFKSTDGGNNWTQVSKLGAAYSQIVVDPLNPQIIYAGYNNAGFPPQTAGMLKSIDGGTTWRKLALSLNGPMSIAYNPKQPLIILASGFGTVYRSLDSGATWKKSFTGITGTLSRISITNAPTNPNLFYASVGSTAGTQLGVWKSSDTGSTWQKMMGYDATVSQGSSNVNPLGNQQQWCNTITVNPTNPKQVFLAGLDMYVSADSGKTWQQSSSQYAFGNYTNYVHADHHRIVFINNVLYDCGDGGLARSVSPYKNVWNTDMNAGLATLEFVGVDADNAFTFVSGGCQDNSTNRALINAPSFTATRGGDGGRGWVSPDDANIVYTTYVRTTFFQSKDGGQSFQNNNPIEQNTALFRIEELREGSGEGTLFYPAYDVSRDGSIVAFGGNSHVWMSTNGGQDGFMAVPPTKSTQVGAVNVIHVFQGEPQTSYIWAGAGNSVWRSTDQGQTWTSKIIGEAVQGITSNPNDHNEIFVVTQGTGAAQKHFFKSTDGGATFTNPAANFPSIGCWSVAYNPSDGNIYVGTDKGVVYSYDKGVTWNPLMNGMPLVEVLSLKIKGAANDKLLAGTYGRGIFWIDASQLTGVNSSNTASEFLSLTAYPNPATSSNAMIRFTLKDPGLTTITLHDLLGRELGILENSYFNSGTHQISLARAGIAAGTYFVQLIENGRSVSQKIVIN